MTVFTSRRLFLQCLSSACVTTLAGTLPIISHAAANVTSSVVVSFSWFENVQPEELAKTAIDSVTGASLLQRGLTSRAAAWIAENLAVPHIVLRTVSAYPADYNRCLDQVITEKTQGVFPPLRPLSAEQRLALEQAQLLYVVFPNWSYTLPRALASFFRDFPLDGKTLAPLCVHGTGGLARTISDMRRMLPRTRILQPLSLERGEVLSSRERILQWAQKATV